MDGLSLNISDDRINQLRQLFPEVFKEDKVDFKQLRATLGDFVATPTEERYGLTWAGKYDAFKEIQKQTHATLTPIPPKNSDWNNSNNIFIEGENLEVLRVLQKSYYGKVKMIYIDPPYNTGNDSFVYPDDFAERQDEYKQKAGIVDENGYLNKQDLFKKNTKENGHFHSAWLSMMYPRLYLARNLMKDDGLIFVSIDDNEKSNLKLLMDEVFGEENFIASLIWKRRQNVDSRTKKGISTDHEYLLVYSKSEQGVLRGADKDLEKYSNPDNDSRGDWMSADMTGLATKEQRPNLHYDLTNPKTGITYPCPPTGWRYEKKRMELLIKNEEVIFPQKPDGRPRRKKFQKDLESDFTGFASLLKTVFNTQGTREVRALFDDKEFFDFPKPKDLIKLLIIQGTNIDSNDLILDFFGGSCTTAHAILELNQEDGGSRKFICIQMPELLDEKSEAYRAGYRTIADIGKARIEKAIEKLKTKEVGKIDFDKQKKDLGFRSYKLQESNFKQWQGNLTDKKSILNQLEVFTDATLTDAKPDNMLLELMLKSGLSLTTKIDICQAGEGVFYHLPKDKLCIALMGFGTDTRLKIKNLKPKQAIILNNLFHNDDELMANTQLEYKEEGIKLIVI
jgi:adenine-specific DNA-methyltransferase